jgi:PTH1 family peptidyl-tRNA hydrolase
MIIKLIVGLRNPGLAYAQTRHNAGAWFLEALAERFRFSFKSNKKMQGDIAEVEYENFRCYALLPLTYMNHSGQSVRAICDFYRIQPQQVLVIHDELDLQPGRAKLKTGGGHGGHNGLRDIISHLGTTEFHRLRIGIGHPGQKDLVHDYVLGKPSQVDKVQILESIERSIEIVPQLLAGQLALAMNRLNSK